MIPCSERCIYQSEGLCGLERARSAGPDGNERCRYRIAPTKTPPRKLL